MKYLLLLATVLVGCSMSFLYEKDGTEPILTERIAYRPNMEVSGVKLGGPINNGQVIKHITIANPLNHKVMVEVQCSDHSFVLSIPPHAYMISLETQSADTSYRQQCAISDWYEESFQNLIDKTGKIVAFDILLGTAVYLMFSGVIQGFKKFWYPSFCVINDSVRTFKNFKTGT